MLYLKIINLDTGEFRNTILSPESNPQNECLIGRSSTCDLMLNSPDVSRFHAKVTFQNQRYLLSDLASTDGVRVNNQEVKLNEDCTLREEDAIYVGSFILWIEKIEAGLALKRHAPRNHPRFCDVCELWKKRSTRKLSVSCWSLRLSFPISPVNFYQYLFDRKSELYLFLPDFVFAHSSTNRRDAKANLQC
ncbi:MAG: FHA domain-containing protein [Leptolyngbyaceae cyanobacterium SM1_3_5]|nr:FHA domain-containing protein [Leptolyngbyaceae cyanobacterium SM1_3_5]